MQLNTLISRGLLSALLCVSSATYAETDPLTEQRQQYLQAKAALERNEFERFNTLRAELNDYPLAPYLDFYRSVKDLAKTNAQQAKAAITKLENTPLKNTYRHRYLMEMGKQKQWQNFLAISPNPPHNITLQCYYYRAQAQQKNFDVAWKGAETLWLHGQSRGEACDPLFQAWDSAGKRSSELVWQRMLLAYEAGQNGLTGFLNKQLTDDGDKARGNLLLELQKNPSKLAEADLSILGKDKELVITNTLIFYAREDAEKAWQAYQPWRGKLGKFEAKTRHGLLFRALIQPGPWSNSELDKELIAHPSDHLIEIRARKEIASGNWQSLNAWLERLPAKKNDNEWLYWRGYALQQIGKQQDGIALWKKLKNSRSFYGFLAAEQLDAPYNIAGKLPSINELEQKQAQKLAVIPRVQELMALKSYLEARTEWQWQLGQSSVAQIQALTKLAHDQQWFFLAVDGTIAGKTWDAVPWRFPLAAYETYFNRFAKEHQVDKSILQAITRRESALYPEAYSHAKAYGLMQLLDPTAKETAKAIGVDYGSHHQLFVPSKNIELGSAYIKGLLDDYDGNRLLATAAYNAGPHRVKVWLERAQGQLDAARFVGTVPYKETREYIQAILSYQVIYNHQAGKATKLMTDAERNRKY